MTLCFGATYRRISAFSSYFPFPHCATPGRCASSYNIGDVMPQHGMNYEGRRRGTRHNTCKANAQLPGTGLVNGVVAHNGCPAAATRTNKSTPASTQNGTKPQCVVNGYINHGHKGKNRRTSPPRTLRKHGGTISAVTDASAAGRVGSADFPGGISVNGAASLDTVDSSYNSKQMTPQHGLSATAKNHRGREKFRLKKRNPTVVYMENPPIPVMPPQKGEDWEKEIQDVTITDWEKMCFGTGPYGPQDVLHFSLRDLTLKQRDTVDLPVTANYSPAVYHPRPVRWSCYSVPLEPDQFADAD